LILTLVTMRRETRGIVEKGVVLGVLLLESGLRG
jgi:hypothetical protein